MNSEKIFVDTVHGQIRVPNEYCKKIIDTIFFQRLRRIEQTSMRSIYPCAHHDRFIHSLGTFHIGVQMFRQIEKSLIERKIEGDNNNLYEEIRKIKLYTDNKISTSSDGAWSVLKRSFELACLLHDCGHAPFSHTFETYFYKDINVILQDMKTLCLAYLKRIKSPNRDRERVADEFVREIKKSQPKKHEIVSAWMVLNPRAFGDVIYELNADPILMARMITGGVFLLGAEKDSIRKKEKSILNCFISLLNGHEIDADRLDYALRDKWASGLNSVNINSNRLTSSLTIEKNQANNLYVICFNKQALPDLQVLIENRNYTNFWVFGHHKTEYQQDLLIKAVEKMGVLFGCDENSSLMKKYISFKRRKKENPALANKSEDNEIRGLINEKLWEIFSYENLVSPRLISFYQNGILKSETLYLISDDDIVHLLKKYFCTQPEVAAGLKSFWEIDNYALEWFQREQVFIPVWKSYSEYMAKYLLKYKELNRIKALVACFECLDCNEKEFKLRLEDRSESFGGQEHLITLFDEYMKMEKMPEHAHLKKVFEKDLKDTLNWYELAIQGDFENALKEVIREIVELDDEYELDYREIKVIPNEIEIKEVKPESLHILIGDEVCCYTQLNLPKKSEHKNYNFFYLFAPRIYTSGKREIDKEDYKQFYEKRLQQNIEAITHVGDEIKYPASKKIEN